MARDASDHAIHAHSVFIRLVLPPYTIHFRSPTYMKEQTLEILDNRVCKEVLKTTASTAEAREAIGLDPKFWPEIVALLKAAVTSLERRSFQIWDPSGADYESTSGALIASNYPGLSKDLERLNNIVSISRNVLTAGKEVQDLAAEHVVEFEIFKLINCAVRVTARGYDGEAGTGDEEKWQHIVNNYKRLLITSLQFLNNLVAQNERRKLMLWVSLFDNTSDTLLSDEQIRSPKLLQPPELPYTKEELLIAYGQNDEETLDLDNYTPTPADAPLMIMHDELIQGRTVKINRYVMFAKTVVPIIIEEFAVEKKEPTLVQLHFELRKKWLETQEGHRLMWHRRWKAAQKKYKNDLTMYESRIKLFDEDADDTVQESRVARHLHLMENELEDKLLLDQEAPSIFRTGLKQDRSVNDPIEKEDMTMPCSAEAGAKILDSGKTELMKRLESYDKPEGFEEPPLVRRASAPVNLGIPTGKPVPIIRDDWSVNSDCTSGPPDPDDEYPGSTEDGRGLLTDVPLILGPSEIEVLPMIVMSGIVPPPNQLAQCKTQSERNRLTDMHRVRCHMLFAQDNGRNLLRELLIFVAAWDLREEELYFKFMVKIMEAILANGIMPYAYYAFRDRSRSKDIISPAQAVIMKLLTNIFRARSEANKVTTPLVRPTKPLPISHSLLPSTPQRVDVHVLHYIFTEFRQHIIPQTCALIFLQGQIHLGRASPEDFPLNLWDMERMYEGVYQYLEFFAVLTEEGFWKQVLGGWHIASELVTLLRELDGGIPKMQILVERVPRSSVPPDQIGKIIRATSADARVPTQTPEPQQIFEAETPLAYPEDAQDEPSDFEWRNLKKLTVLVLSSLIWKNSMVQDQVYMYGGLLALVACCKQDEHNPYIREHAIMCLRFAVEDNERNAGVIRRFAERGRQGEIDLNEDVPKEVLDANGYETFMDGRGQIGLRRKEPNLPTVPTLASQSRPMLPPMQAGMSKLTPEKAAELMQNALKELPLGMGASLAKGIEGLIKGERS